MGNCQAYLKNLEFLGGFFDVRISLLERSHTAGRRVKGSLCGDARELKVKSHKAAGTEVLQDLR
jgi:hypothetical protein